MSLLGVLFAVSEKALGDDGLGALAADDLRFAHGGVDAADLHGLHLDARALVKVDDRGGVHHARTLAVALAVVLFHIAYVGVFGDVERVDAVVAALVAAGVVDAAACDDVDVAVFADVEVVVDHFGHAALADDDGDVALLALRTVLDADDDAAFTLGLRSMAMCSVDWRASHPLSFRMLNAPTGLPVRSAIFSSREAPISVIILCTTSLLVQHRAGAQRVRHDERENFFCAAAVLELAAAPRRRSRRRAG